MKDIGILTLYICLSPLYQCCQVAGVTKVVPIKLQVIGSFLGGQNRPVGSYGGGDLLSWDRQSTHVW